MRLWWVLALVPGVLVAQVPIKNPGLPDHEVLRYVEAVGGVRHPFESSLNLVDDPTPHYEFHSVGVDLETTFHLHPNNLLSYWSQMVNKGPEATVVRTSEYNSIAAKARGDQLVVTDLGSLAVMLRGFPWGKVSSVQLIYLGNTTYTGPGIAFDLQVVGREPVKGKSKTWECWHVSTGLAGALGLVLPRTDWWFAVDGTHPLVKMAGPLGGPGSPTRTLTLESDVEN